MLRRLLLVLGSILLGVPWASLACAQSEEKSLAHAERAISIPQSDAQVARAEADTVVLEGTVIRKPWTKTGESWNAGGSHYFVLT